MTTPLKLSILSLSLISAASAQITIVQHTFDGADVSLNGASVDTTVVGVGTTWAADGSYRQDGDLASFGDTTGSAFVDLGTIINDTKGTASGIFTLTTVINSTGTGSGDWIGVGFQQGAGDVLENFTNATNPGIGTMIWRVTDDIDAFNFRTTDIPSSNEVAVVSSGSATLTTTIDLSGWDGTANFGTIAYSVNGGTALVDTFAADYSFDNILLSRNSSSIGNYESIELTQIPEPSAYALIAGCLALGSIMIRRRG